MKILVFIYVANREDAADFEGVSYILDVSVFIVIFVWKPFFLFHEALHVPILIYIQGFFKHLFCIFVGGMAFVLMHNLFDMSFSLTSWHRLIVYAIIVGIVLSIIQFATLYVGSRGMRDFISRFLKRNSK